MRVAIAIVPGVLMAVVTAGWNELVQNCRQIAFQARLEFNRTQRGLTGSPALMSTLTPPPYAVNLFLWLKVYYSE